MNIKLEKDTDLDITVFEKIKAELMAELGIGCDRECDNVIIYEDHSQFDNDIIYVNCNEDLEMTKMLFKHELVHCLIEKHYGNEPGIFWEGIPIWFANNPYRVKNNGISYHEVARILIEKGKLLELEQYISKDAYYSERSDYRLDIEAGSLTGYIIQTYGVDLLFDFVKRCTEEPQTDVKRIFSEIFELSFSDLFEQWKSYLVAEIPIKKEYFAKL